MGARVLIGLSDTLIADAFDLLLGDAGFLVQVCSGESDSLVRSARRWAPEVVLVGREVLLPDGHAPALTALHDQAPEARVVVLLREEESCGAALLRHGVRGVIPPKARTTDVVGVLRQVLDGNVVYPGLALERLAEPVVLSERQREVLEHVALGRSNEEIAQRLYISRNTVKFHLREIYSRLGVRNRVEAARAARRAL
jgi:DNA-binding NarL/FixJ family response regulator